LPGIGTNRLGSKCRTGTNCLGNFGRPEHLAAGPSSLIHRIYIIYKGWYQIIASSTWGNFASESALVPWKSKTSFLMGFHWVTRLGLIIKTSRSWYSVLLYIFLSLSLCIPPRKSHEATASPASMVVTSLSLKFFALLTLYQFSVHFKTVHLWLLPINMVVSCCVINCTNRFNKYNPRSFYRIPKKPDDRRKSWIAAIKRVSPNGQQWEPTVATVMIFLLKHHIYLYFFT
jgi:hypothetical protein